MWSGEKRGTVSRDDNDDDDDDDDDNESPNNIEKEDSC